jgi:hypothetical protein
VTALQDQREQLVAALSFTVPDGGPELTGMHTAPDVIGVWDAWLVWDSSTWASRCVTNHTWRVYVAIPNGDAMGSNAAADALLEPVAEHLSALGHVDRAQPVVWQTDGMQGYPCVQFTITI